MKRLFHERFWNKVEKTDTCWLWKGHKLVNGYGQFRIDSKTAMVAHRLAYILVKGEIKPGLTLDHLCRTRECVNPEHLEPVTQRENVIRGKVILNKTTNLPTGVYARGNKFISTKFTNGKSMYLGIFSSIEEAARKYTIS